MNLKPWSVTVVAASAGIAFFFTGWAIAPNIPAREMIGFIGICVGVVTALVAGILGREK